MTEDKKAELCEIVDPLLKWYDDNARILPWRENTEPYRVWVSEIMLQQTQVETVKPYFDRFIREIPTFESLASINEEKLLKFWEGLGYYNRVRNMQKAARMIMEKYKGRFPDNYEDILELPGIGEYTVGAILSISFGKPIPAVDGNVLRVVTRITGSEKDITDLKVKKEIGEMLSAIYPKTRCGDFTQSLMELGATVCMPNGHPKCDSCPLRTFCLANRTNMQMIIPVKSKKKPKRKEQKTVFLLCCEDKVAINKRAGKALLGGLWEFPNSGENMMPEQVKNLLSDWDIPIVTIEKGIKHKAVFTHIEWDMQSYRVTCKEMSKRFLWVGKAALQTEIAMPSAFQKFQKFIIEYL